MKNVTKTLLTGVGLMSSLTAFAIGTAAGTPVNNSASVDFTVGGVNQTDVNSNVATFVVDRKILFTVTKVGSAYSSVVPGQTDAVVAFTIANQSNDVLDFSLAASNGGTNPYVGTDNFDPSALDEFGDNDDSGTYVLANDTLGYMDELAADDSKLAFVVADISGSQVNSDIAVVTLTATAHEGGLAASLGALVTETAGAETAGSVDTVFADDVTTGDGIEADADAYQVVSATIVVVKSSKIVSDPINNTTNPKRIPGAIVEYIIKVDNTGSAVANSVNVSDTIPATLAFLTTVDFDTGIVGDQPIQITSTDIESGGVSAHNGGGEDADALNADESDANANNAGIATGANFAAQVFSGSVATVPALGTVYLRFRATVQ